MTNTPHQNLMLSKIDKIRLLFNKEVENGKQVIVSNMKDQDIEVLDSFILVEDSDYGKLEDILISFRAKFSSFNEYSAELVNELLASFKVTKEFAGDNEWVLKNWKVEDQINNEKNKKSPAFFFNVLQSMIDASRDFEAKIFVYLSPGRMENKKEFEKWIEESLIIGIPKRCGILVAENSDDPYLSKMTSSYPENTTIIVPDLKMDESIKQMATAGNPASPDVQFRKYFFSMQEGVAKKDADHILHWRNKAKDLAIKLDWKDMVVTTDLAAGTFMLHVNETGNAIQFYNEAIESGNELIKTNSRLGNPLTIQAFAAKGAALISVKSYDKAISVYEFLGDFATNVDDYMNAMEAWRMAGYCYRKSGEKSKALWCNQNALKVAEKMNPDLRQHTTLPYVGKELFELTPRDAEGMKALEEIDFKLKSYVGNEWQNRY